MAKIMTLNSKDYLNHPMEVFTGIKTYKIVQKKLTKENLDGCVNFDKYLLTIDPSLYEEDYKNTLLHEICHIGFDLYGLGGDDEMPAINNEYLTTVTSNMIQQLAGLNRELFKYIFEGSVTSSK